MQARPDESGAGSADGTREESCVLEIADVRGFTSVLQALKSGNKQVCSMTIAPTGLSIRWEDESKMLQCHVHLPCELFERYQCGSDRDHTFGVQLNTLLDTLAIFSSSNTGASLQLKYPGQNGELLCSMEASEGYAGSTMTSYALLSSVEPPDSRDLSEFWETPASQFMASGALMKEAVEDLEWPAGDVGLILSSPPNRLRLRAFGVPGDVEVELPTSELLGFVLSAPGDGSEVQRGVVEHTYKYRAMKAAFCSLPSARDNSSSTSSTKVAVDLNGMLKVTHRVTLQGSGPLPLVHTSSAAAASTQRHPGQSVLITVITVPVVEGERDD